jgi:hypothetical protein
MGHEEHQKDDVVNPESPAGQRRPRPQGRYKPYKRKNEHDCGNHKTERLRKAMPPHAKQKKHETYEAIGAVHEKWPSAGHQLFRRF